VEPLSDLAAENEFGGAQRVVDRVNPVLKIVGYSTLLLVGVH
jgi:hypothetical protein